MNNQSVPKRFSRISTVIDIQKLERESMKFFYMGLVIGVFIHLLAGFLISYTPPEFRTAERGDVQYMKVDLITVPPSVEKIDDREERAFTSKTYIEEILRHGIPGDKFEYKVLDTSVKPRMMVFHGIEEAVQYVLKMQSDFLDSLIFEIDPILGDMESYIKYRELTISREPGDSYSHLDEMMTIDDIDYQAIYKGFVIRDMNDKQNLKGFLRIPMIAQTTGIKAVMGLGEAFNHYTGVKVIVDDNFINLDTRRLLDYPFLYIKSFPNHVFRMNEKERKNFALYLKSGGLTLLDNSEPWDEFSPGEASLYLMLVDALGEDFDFRPIPYDHPVYNCFFDMNGLAPEGTEKWLHKRMPGQINWGFLSRDQKTFRMLKGISEKVSNQRYSLWGVWIDDRLAAIYSDKGYGYIWMEGPLSFKTNFYYSGSEEKYDFNPQLKLGVNMLVYAMLREGSVTKKVTDYSTLNK
ncbi:DUF4159 domain-containing protein [Candidatus Latescibacterota bacterium]